MLAPGEGTLPPLLFPPLLHRGDQAMEGILRHVTFTTPYLVNPDGWQVRALRQPGTRLWSEKSPAGHLVFRYNASVQSFIADQPFEEQRVEGTIPRRWV